MSKIKVLDWLVVNKIAAGEVIERPASVVKELVENSVDADSTQIDIHLEDGGKKLIRITDDGVGIAQEDLNTAFLNHATSKIKDVEDIFSIHTMGFRGEALPSIASIARVTLRSRTEDSSVGYKIEVDNGVVSEPIEDGMSQGTQIDVEDIFYNTPVRQKFLKTTRTELSYISKMVSQLALAHEHCGFCLTHEGKQIFKLHKNMDLRSRIETVYGKKLIEEAISVAAEIEDIEIKAFIGKPSAAKPKSSHVYFFLNGRPIKDKNLGHAFRESYGEFLAPNRFPHGFIFINMNPELVDVNVHPTKTEVRFENPGKMYSLLLNQFKHVLRNSNLAPPVKMPLTALLPSSKRDESVYSAQQENKSKAPAPKPLEPLLPFVASQNTTNNTLDNSSIRSTPLFNTTTVEEEASPKVDYPTGTAPIAPGPAISYPTGVKPPNESGTSLSPAELETLLKSKNSQPAATKPPTIPESLNSELSTALSANSAQASNSSTPTSAPIGIEPGDGWNPWGKVFQLHHSYIIEETKNGFQVIDQHALHERILAFKIRDVLESSQKYSQRLLIPETIELGKADFLLLMDQKEQLVDFGIEIDVFGESAIAVNSIPLLLKDAPIKEILYAILGELRENGEVRNSVEGFRESVINMMACKAAVKYGQRLNERELVDLLKARFTVEHTHNCPHGRPTTLHFSNDDLDRQFHRH